MSEPCAMGMKTRRAILGGANMEDPVLARIEHRKPVPTLLAEEVSGGHYRIGIRLRGHGETIFFDI